MNNKLPLEIITTTFNVNSPTIFNVDSQTIVEEVAILFGITISLLMIILILIILNTFIRGKKA